MEVDSIAVGPMEVDSIAVGPTTDDATAGESKGACLALAWTSDVRSGAGSTALRLARREEKKSRWVARSACW
jgi:hypothetical protein